MLRFSNVSAGYGGVPVLREISFDVAEGEAVANEVAHEFEDQAVDGLVRGVVFQPAAEFVRGDGYAAVLGDPSGLAAAGQAHQDDDALLRQRCSARQRGLAPPLCVAGRCGPPARTW